MAQVIAVQRFHVLGGDFAAMRRSALVQPFLRRDPSKRDDVERRGLRPTATVCFEWSGFADFLTGTDELIRELADGLESGVRLADSPGQIELTKLTDGGAFAAHIDGDYANAPLRKVAFVYYLGDRDSFTGGQLRIGSELIDPVDDSLVVFPGSDVVHEVLPIRGRDARRLTINGYFDII